MSDYGPSNGVFVILAPQGYREVIGDPILLSFAYLEFWYLFISPLTAACISLLGIKQKSFSFLGSHMFSIFKSKVKCSVLWQSSKAWKPHGPPGLNSFSIESKLIFCFWKLWTWLAETAESRNKEEASGGQKEASPSQSSNGMRKALIHTFISY